MTNLVLVQHSNEQFHKVALVLKKPKYEAASREINNQVLLVGETSCFYYKVRHILYRNY